MNIVRTPDPSSKSDDARVQQTRLRLQEHLVQALQQCGYEGKARVEITGLLSDQPEEVEESIEPEEKELESVTHDVVTIDQIKHDGVKEVISHEVHRYLEHYMESAQ